jgi:hypothetical protein
VQEDEDGDEETVPPVEKLALSLNLKYEPDQSEFGLASSDREFSDGWKVVK